MDTTFLLQRLAEYKELQIDFRALEEMQEFKKEVEVPSLINIALMLEGHKPVTEFRFDRKLFEIWCERHNLHSFYDIEKREYYLKYEN